jgi:type IV pilus assembly protein PilA
MKNEQGFSLVELLIVVAIIAIIAAIAVPSLLTSKQAANEASAIQGCRTLGSAEIAFAATNNQAYTTLDVLVAGNYLDSRFNTSGNGFNGYTYAPGAVATGAGAGDPPTGFQFHATPSTGGGRYTYGIAPDQVVRYLAAPSGATPPVGLAAGDPIGKQ